MKAKIRKKGLLYRAECANCGRFLSELHGTTNIVNRCSSCKRDNTIKIIYNDR
jgi:LSD1 subclass zinc finger protein